ncbi:solute carrier family 13 (sodium-dependent dicarboxylate transporter), member 2/3/5 [Franzmannia pantelleriensis]|uniref:Solute carrier family 13 (Sodium-dependent dicarboxylate transporter), member 2/3/5 n=1 Tax=Franzmannia pantelleriensis TaxID=48727 RepID=A0A1G9R6W2_9GAMM|nr:SLC13 family permease [Halomonas pantelleriensis]SDM18860.1 solute carrier family 13 (sodium-dependent dicarboxylate transporter), member 2/3/5 [Halomonas pantelleriensis]
MSEQPHQQPGLDDSPSGRSASMIWGLRGFGLFMALLVWLAMGQAEGLSSDARWVAAIGTLMAVWWMTEAIPLSATSLLPIVLIPMLTERTVGQATAPYASPIVFLFLGGFLIAIAMEKWNLHRRIALMTLARVGVEPKRIVLGMMLATGFLSMWVSNTATTLMMLPIGLSVLALVAERSGESLNEAAPGHDPAGNEHDHHRAGHVDFIFDDNIKRFGLCLLLAIAWSASMGGLGTLLGSPPNAIVAGYAADELGRNIGFLEWMMLGVPLAFTFILIGWVMMTRVLYPFKVDEIPGGKEMIAGEIHKLGPFSQGEKMVMLVFLSAAFLWVVPGLLGNLPWLGERLGPLGELNDTAIAVAAGIAMFILPGRGRSEMVLTWQDAEDGLPWGVLLLFGGGLSLAGAVAASGLDSWFGQQVSGLGMLPIILLVAAVATIILFLTEVTSNTATAATFIPVLGGVALGIGADPMTLLIPAAFAATCAFMLPVGTPPNAIVFGTGAVTIGQMARGGIVLNVIGIVLITLFCYLLGGFALGLAF